MLCTTPGSLRSRSLLWRRKFHPRAPCLRQANRDRLFRRSSTMFSFADMMHLFSNELARLGCGCLTPTFIAFGSLYGFFFWHRCLSLREFTLRAIPFLRADWIPLVINVRAFPAFAAACFTTEKI